MTFAPTSAPLGVLASIPSPEINRFFIGPVPIHFYALCIIAGIIVAVFLTNHRLTKRGGEPWVVIDICLLAVPIAIVGARIFHVVTHPGFYFGEGSNPWNPFEPGSVWAIWEGGIAICLSGRGDKDMDTAARYFELYDAENVPVVAPTDEDDAKGEGIEL